MAEYNEQGLIDSVGYDAARVFRRHAKPAQAGELRSRIQHVDTHLVEIREALADNEFIDLELAERITAACKDLVKLGNLDDPQHQILIAGAIGYFLDPDDAEDDLESVLGLEDDAGVVNFVIRELGLPIDQIPLEDD